jgi:hypothetical protein
LGNAWARQSAPARPSCRDTRDLALSPRPSDRLSERAALTVSKEKRPGPPGGLGFTGAHLWWLPRNVSQTKGESETAIQIRQFFLRAPRLRSSGRSAITGSPIAQAAGRVSPRLWAPARRIIGVPPKLSLDRPTLCTVAAEFAAVTTLEQFIPLTRTIRSCCDGEAATTRRSYLHAVISYRAITHFRKLLVLLNAMMLLAVWMPRMLGTKFVKIRPVGAQRSGLPARRSWPSHC